MEVKGMCCAKVHRKKTDKRIAVSIIAIPETHANPSTTCLFPFINSHIYLNNHFLTTFSYIRIIFLFSFFFFSSLFFWSIRREKIKVVIKIVIYDCINKIAIYLFFSHYFLWSPLLSPYVLLLFPSLTQFPLLLLLS